MSENMNLFENLNDNEAWKKEWKDMPEFDQKDLTPKHSIIINFESMKDLKDFGKLLEQDLTDKTKSIWFPAQEKEPPKNLGYVLFDKKEKETKNES